MKRFLTLAICLAACGGDDDAAPAADGGMLDAAGDATSGDAASGFPAAHHPLPLAENFGGPVLAHVKIVTVTFAGDPDRDAKRSFDDALVDSDWWDAVTAGYGIGRGTSGGHVELPDTVSNRTIDNESELVPLVAEWAQDGTLPAPDADTLYAIYFPESTTITSLGDASCQAFGGFHDYAKLADGSFAAYAVLPDCGGGLPTITISHEAIEAATDPLPFIVPDPPDPFTWYAYNDAWFGSGGGEVADLCEGRGTATLDGFEVATSWSNLAAAASANPCQPADPSKIFFGSAVDTEVVTGQHDTVGNGPDYASDGFIVVPAGGSKTVNVTVFSERALPHDLDLVVGRRTSSSDPHDVGQIASGVTATLSQTTGKNGDHVDLQLTVAPAATPGDHVFVVRAILENDDYHSWPVVLRVTPAP